MTVHVVVSCANCDNERWTPIARTAGKNPVPRELDAAEEDGWQIGGGLSSDYCPDCRDTA